MKPARSQSELLSLDVLALALMCCLLAAVVGVLVLGSERKPQAEGSNKPSAPVPPWPVLRQKSSRLYAQVGELERSRELLVTKINHSVLERENHELRTRLSLLEHNVELVNLLALTRAETEKLLFEKKEREKAEAAITPEKKKMLGEYKGPYVLVECLEDGAMVYPGGERIDSPPSSEQKASLLEKIRKAGFVAFVARPSGWYGNSYDKLRQLVYQELVEAEKEGGKHIGRTCLPLDTPEPIKDYLPAEVRP